MPDYIKTNKPELTHTLDEFIQVGQYSDEQTYAKFSILDRSNGMLFLDHNILDDYMEFLQELCVECKLDDDQQKTYYMRPDLLAFDVYGSSQLDFVVLKVNGMIDQKDFTLPKIRLPYASSLKTFLTSIYNAELGYINQNRIDLGIYV